MSSAPELDARVTRHREAHERSYALLESTRLEAKKKRKYNSAEVRREMTDLCKKKTGLTPYPEQLDLAECTLLGLDATCVAGTGWGKTLPFALPLFVYPRKIIIIISPLNALEADQADRFQKMGLRAIAINGTTYTPEVEKAVRLGHYSVILVGPKMCVDTECSFRDILSSPDFGKRVLGLHVDEAHCIAQWGAKFRPEYSHLEAVRALLPCQIPVQVTSATMPPHVLKLAHDTMNIDPSRSFYLNLGNDRHNITWEVRYMKAGRQELDELELLLPTSPEATTLTKTMVFFNDITLSMKARRWLRQHLPPALYSRVRCYNARRGEQSKKHVLQQFRDGDVDVLLATEAAGMGCDIPDVVDVVQFKATDSLSTWMQRAGRAGRRASIQARAVLLVEPSVFQEMGKTTRKEGDPIVYKKTIEPGLRCWLGAPTEECRRDIADEYFDNPLGRKAPTGLCCDNCTHRALASSPMDETTSAPSTSSTDMPNSMPSTSPVEQAPIDRYDPANWKLYVLPTRRDNHLKEAQARLEEWRSAMWLSQYSSQPFGAEGILPNAILTSLAARTSYRTVEDVRDLRWVLAKRHAAEVLQLLRNLDREVALEEMAKERAQKEREAAKALEKEAEREQERIRKMIEAAKKHEEAVARKERVEAYKACVKAAKVAVKGIVHRQREVIEEEVKARKVAEKEAEKARKAAEKEAEKARKAAEKEAEKVRKAAEKEAEKMRKAAEKEAEKLRKAEERKKVKAGCKEQNAVGGEVVLGRKRKRMGEGKGNERGTKRVRSGKENEPLCGNNSQMGPSLDASAGVVAPAADVSPRLPPRPRPLKRPRPPSADNPLTCPATPSHSAGPNSLPRPQLALAPMMIYSTPQRPAQIPHNASYPSLFSVTTGFPPTPTSLPRVTSSLAQFHSHNLRESEPQ